MKKQNVATREREKREMIKNNKTRMSLGHLFYGCHFARLFFRFRTFFFYFPLLSIYILFLLAALELNVTLSLCMYYDFKEIKKFSTLDCSSFIFSNDFLFKKKKEFRLKFLSYNVIELFLLKV